MITDCDTYVHSRKSTWSCLLHVFWWILSHRVSDWFDQQSERNRLIFALKKQNRDVCKNPVKAIFWMDFCTWGGFLFLAWLRFMSLGQLQCVFRSSVLFWLVFFSPVRNISYCHEFKWQLFREIGCFLKIFVNMQTKEICTAVLVSVWRNSHRWEWGSLQKFTSGIRQKVLRISDTGLFWRICAAVVLPVLI